MDVREILGRPEREVDHLGATAAFSDRVVLVTGAGGSIGSELCAALADLPVARLVMLEQSEGNLVDLERRLGDGRRVMPVIGDVTDRAGLRSLMLEVRPDVVYHAAALKHVVLLEDHPLEAARVNVLGTQRVVEACTEAEVSELVLLSTDKAVAPTSFMGATKNLGEQLVRVAATGGGPRGKVARLVNVVGSRGSVIPRFEQQVRAGTPLTVTDPEATRWFISSREAVALLIAAATIGEHGDTLVPEAGRARRMADVALAILGAPELGEGAILTTGLRAGEKLHEDLLADTEHAESTGVEGVLRVRASRRDAISDLGVLEAALERRDPASVVRFVRRHVNEYQPSEAVMRFIEAPSERP